MAMTDAPKRKEPEPESTAPATTSDSKEEAAQSPAKAAEAQSPAKASSPAAAPDAKRQKLGPTPPEPAAVRKQVEYYLSDENLKTDKFFHDKMREEPDGWLDMALILSCKKMKAMRATKEEVVAALKESKIEVREDGAAIRRPGNAALPPLEEKKQQFFKKSSIHAHDGGVVSVFKGLPAEQNWPQVKEQVKAKLPEKVVVWHVSEASEKINQCYVVTAPFDGDVAFFDSLSIELGGVTLKAEVCHGDELGKALKAIPKHIREKREKESKKTQTQRNKPMQIGNHNFVSMGALRGKVKEILNSRNDGESLKFEGSDYNLIRALLSYHPKGADKSQGLIGIKVNKSVQGDGRCFYMIKEGGQEEDFSAKKCLDAVEANPPYAKNEKPQAKPKDTSAAASSQAKAPEAKPADATATPAAAPAEGADAKAKEPAAATETPAAATETPAAATEKPAAATETPAAASSEKAKE